MGDIEVHTRTANSACCHKHYLDDNRPGQMVTCPLFFRFRDYGAKMDRACCRSNSGQTKLTVAFRKRHGCSLSFNTLSRPHAAPWLGQFKIVGVIA